MRSNSSFKLVLTTMSDSLTLVPDIMVPENVPPTVSDILDLSPSANPPSHLRQTHRLLSLGILYLAAASYCCQIYEHVYFQIYNTLRTGTDAIFVNNPNIPQPFTVLASFQAYAQACPHIVCISNAGDNYWMGIVIWGITSLADGRLRIQLNGALAAAYETLSAISEPTTKQSQDQANLGTILYLTHLHELCHHWLRGVLKHGIDGPELERRKNLLTTVKGHSGQELEHLMIGGTLHARWDNRDVFEQDRFTRIQSLWLKRNGDAEYRQLPPDDVLRFHNRILAGTAADLSLDEALRALTANVDPSPGAGILDTDPNVTLLRLSPLPPDAKMKEGLPVEVPSLVQVGDHTFGSIGCGEMRK
ncbi:hypothetical protein MKEN_01052700 [Mycena kentingensis (nom. inval.)]|nr:hypothetical protein MKEN_01052700 [Mycena kentingensis (nom. inval.)]